MPPLIGAKRLDGLLTAKRRPHSPNWGLAAIWRWVCIHHMNQVNSYNGLAG